MEHPNSETLLQLAREFLNEKGQEEVSLHLCTRKFHYAQSYLLGAIDRLHSEGRIDDVVARHAYRRLAMDPDEAAQQRQRSSLRHQ